MTKKEKLLSEKKKLIKQQLSGITYEDAKELLNNVIIDLIIESGKNTISLPSKR